ncbi:hypothetical protein V6N13_073834 [Hibiscus sabdariffa]
MVCFELGNLRPPFLWIAGCRRNEGFKGIQKEMCLPCSLDFTELMAIRFALKVFVEAGLKGKFAIIVESESQELKFGVNQVVVLASLIMREICSEDFCGLGYDRLRLLLSW